MADLDLQNFQIEYINPTFYNAVNISIKRQGRNKPYFFSAYLDYKQYVGDNLTMKANVYEVIGGRNILTPLRFEYTLCYFLTHDSFAGKMFGEHLPSNVTCPFAPGIVEIKQVMLHTENLPSVTTQIFTYSSLSVKICIEVECLYVNERILLAKTYMNVKMKLNNRHINNKMQ
ncbi:unnamed protein product [Arctia plantaginis]|uniref:Uncharacterized protein n=1 Tax=Arctia plantaginis TaxID=874455 RepID=A0A8S0ZT09_ARCPL|nr:unnamed protein product [Arctia plantaginis]